VPYAGPVRGTLPGVLRPAVGTEPGRRQDEGDETQGDEKNDHRHRPRRLLALRARDIVRADRCRSAAWTIVVRRSCAIAAAIAG